MDVNVCMENGISFFFIVCVNGNENIVKLLINNRVDINVYDKDGIGFFFIVCLYGYDNIV